MMMKTTLNFYARHLSSSPPWKRNIGALTVFHLSKYRRERWKMSAIASPLLLVPHRGFISTVISTGDYEELAKHLGCSLTEANNVYRETSTTTTTKGTATQIAELKRNIEFYKANGLSRELLFKNTWLLALPIEMIAPKVYYLNKIGINSFTIGLLKFQLEKLVKVVHRYAIETASLNDRIAYLANTLTCSVTEVTRIVEKHTFLLSIEREKLVRIADTLRENGIRGQEMRNDVWVFRGGEDTIRERIERARDVGLTPIRTWMLRCTEKAFSKKLDRFCEANEVLREHGGDCATYLAHRLSCQRQYVDYVVRRNPKLLSIHPPKLKQILDFLYDIGFTHTHICQFPVILSHNVEMLRHRHAELSELGYIPKNLQVLCSPSERYQRLLSKIKEEKVVAKIT